MLGLLCVVSVCDEEKRIWIKEESSWFFIVGTEPGRLQAEGSIRHGIGF